MQFPAANSRRSLSLIGPCLVCLLSGCAALPNGPNAQLTEVGCQVHPMQGEPARIGIAMAVGGKTEVADATLKINYGDGSEQSVPHVHPASIPPDVGRHVYKVPGHYRVTVRLTGPKIAPLKKSCELDVIPAPPPPPKA